MFLSIWVELYIFWKELSYSNWVNIAKSAMPCKERIMMFGFQSDYLIVGNW
jgi:hypothetical protein